MNEMVENVLKEIPGWKSLMDVGYVARLLGVDRRTVRRYIESGKLGAFGLPGRDGSKVGLYRIPKESLKIFLTQYGSYR